MNEAYCHGCKKMVPLTRITSNVNALYNYCLDCDLDRKEQHLAKLVQEIEQLKQKKEQIIHG